MGSGQESENYNTLTPLVRIKRPPKVSDRFTLASISIFLTLCLLFVRLMDERLPEPLTLEDSTDNPGSFIGQRAWEDMAELTAIGPRVVGSNANENITIGILLNKIKQISLEVSSPHKMEFEVQRASGAFELGNIKVYSEISNVIVRLGPSDGTINRTPSVLLNCHYDSGSSAPGATDNMISCAAMLEVLRILSRGYQSFPNTLIFLFNGAEESGLLGVHGFLEGNDKNGTQASRHPWALNLKAFINLEGAGSGGRPILFQTGPGNGWIANLYASSVPRPFGTVLGEEAFQMGIIPSDTDFRIFRDYANIPGLDNAFVKNGWIYHTKWDTINEIRGGSVQHLGDTVLGLSRRFSTFDFGAIFESETNMVFFDVFGIFMVVYSETVGIAIHVLLALAFIGITTWIYVIKLKKYLNIVWYLGSTFLAWGVGIAVAVTIAAIFSGTGYKTPFHSYPFLLFVIYGIPATISHVIVYAFVTKGNVEMAWVSGKFVMAVVVFIGSFITRATYLPAAIILFGGIGWYSTTFLLKEYPRMKLVVYLIVGELVPTTLVLYTLNILNEILVPSFARTGPGTDPSILLSFLTGFTLPVLVLGGIVPFFVGFKKSNLIAAFVFSALFLNSLIIIGFIGQNPYRQKTSMRLTTIETDRTWYLDGHQIVNVSDAGMILWPVDPNTDHFMDILGDTVSEVRETTRVDLDPETCAQINCGVPEFSGSGRGSSNYMYWLPREVAVDQSGMRMEIVHKVWHVDSGVWEVSLRFHGATTLSIILSPAEDFKLSHWTLPTAVPESGNLRKGRETYFVTYNSGMPNLPFEITMNLRKEGQSSSDSLLNVMFNSFSLYGDEMLSPWMKMFTDKFPSWTELLMYRAQVQFHTISTE